MNCATAILNEPIPFELQCQKCDARVMVTVHFTQLYSAMNLLGWGLVPSHHGREVKGLCPKCWPVTTAKPAPRDGMMLMDLG
jgi:hypothetical protein